MNEMKTLTILGKTYEIADQQARDALEKIGSNSTIVSNVLAAIPYSSAVKIAQADNTITVTVSLNDGSESVSIVELDSNGYPTSITTDGVKCAITWEGFAETEEATTNE